MENSNEESELVLTFEELFENYDGEPFKSEVFESEVFVFEPIGEEKW